MIRFVLCTVCVFHIAANSCGQDAAPSEPGFVSLFNGENLDGWDGDPRFWRVEDGVIIGQTTKDNKADHNTFLIRRDDEYGDFELRFSYQVKAFNSGVQYRSIAQDDYVVKGYQADFEDRWHDGTTDKFSGMFFEENGRMFMGQRGQAVIVRDAAGRCEETRNRGCCQCWRSSGTGKGDQPRRLERLHHHRTWVSVHTHHQRAGDGDWMGRRQSESQSIGNLCVSTSFGSANGNQDQERSRAEALE